MIFRDRRDAGRALARIVGKLHDLGDAVVLGLPRGGVPGVQSRVVEQS